MSTLQPPLPANLEWLTPSVRALVRPTAYLCASDSVVAPVGATRIGGLPDLPCTGQPKLARLRKDELLQSPYDGLSHWLQLDLGDIPQDVRSHLPAGLPAHGLVWLLADLSTDWRVEVHFDPRKRESIDFRPRDASQRYPGTEWLQRTSLPAATERTLPEISWDYRDTAGQSSEYEEWVFENYLHKRPTEIQLGGWVWPCQGDFDQRQETFVLGLENQSFGDSGAVYLHYSAERGFFGFVDTH